MANIGQFNANEHEASQAFDLMPKHWTTAIIEDSELKPTAAGDGQRLNFTFVIVDGQQFAKRKIWAGLNIQNPNEKAVQIAQSDLAAICNAVTKPQIQDSSEVHGIPLDILVGVTKETYRKDPNTGQDMLGADGKPIVEYDAKNEIKGYAPAGTKASASGAPGGVPAGSPVATAPAAMPAQVATPATAPVTMPVIAPVTTAAIPVTTAAQVETTGVNSAAAPAAVDGSAPPAWSQPAQ